MAGNLGTSTGVALAFVALIILDTFAVVLGLSFVRGRRAQKAAAAGTSLPSGKSSPAVSRREFFRHSLLTSLLVFGAEFGGASLAFLWPNLKGGFGSIINVGALADIKATIAGTGQPYYYGAARAYIVPYAGRPTSDANYGGEGVATQGIMSLYQRCVHLGCRVPFCSTSKWFECPCHGSKYNEAGEYQLGPAPRGMDRFPTKIESGNVILDTSTVILGPVRGTNTIHEPPQGPFCVAPG